MNNIISEITQKWFLSEPLLFNIFCSHELIENNLIMVPFRTGKRRIEYNSDILSNLTTAEIEEYLKIEIIRILLKHPYQRIPTGDRKPYLTIASDSTIFGCYNTDVKLDGVEFVKEFAHEIINLQHYFSGRTDKLTLANNQILKRKALQISSLTEKEIYNNELMDGTPIDYVNTDDGVYITTQGTFHLIIKSDLEMWFQRMFINDKGIFEFPRNLSFEEWYTKIIAISEFTSEKGSEKIHDGNKEKSNGRIAPPRSNNQRYNKLSDTSELWDDDELTVERINQLIDEAERTAQWGALNHELKNKILANKKVALHYSEILRHFSTSILSSKRYLTRMKPNRRFGLERPGNRYKLISRLLIAVDVSSSIAKEELEYAFSIINQFFKYGLEKLEVIQFTTKVLGEAEEISKALEKITIHGSGGTDFQPAADYYCAHKEYDGLIYFTDGFGLHPDFKKRQKVDVLWIFTTKYNYNKGIKWAENIPGNICTYIPLP